MAELEEKEREESFRLKRFKQLKFKRQNIKISVCACCFNSFPNTLEAGEGNSEPMCEICSANQQSKIDSRLPVCVTPCREEKIVNTKLCHGRTRTYPTAEIIPIPKENSIKEPQLTIEPITESESDTESKWLCMDMTEKNINNAHEIHEMFRRAIDNNVLLLMESIMTKPLSLDNVIKMPCEPFESKISREQLPHSQSSYSSGSQKINLLDKLQTSPLVVKFSLLTPSESDSKASKTYPGSKTVSPKLTLRDEPCELELCISNYPSSKEDKVCKSRQNEACEIEHALPTPCITCSEEAKTQQWTVQGTQSTSRVVPKSHIMKSVKYDPSEIMPPGPPCSTIQGEPCTPCVLKYALPAPCAVPPPDESPFPTWTIQGEPCKPCTLSFPLPEPCISQCTSNKPIQTDPFTIKQGEIGKTCHSRLNFSSDIPKWTILGDPNITELPILKPRSKIRSESQSSHLIPCKSRPPIPTQCESCISEFQACTESTCYLTSGEVSSVNIQKIVVVQITKTYNVDGSINEEKIITEKLQIKKNLHREREVSVNISKEMSCTNTCDESGKHETDTYHRDEYTTYRVNDIYRAGDTDIGTNTESKGNNDIQENTRHSGDNKVKTHPNDGFRHTKSEHINRCEQMGEPKLYSCVSVGTPKELRNIGTSTKTIKTKLSRSTMSQSIDTNPNKSLNTLFNTSIQSYRCHPIIIKSTKNEIVVCGDTSPYDSSSISNHGMNSILEKGVDKCTSCKASCIAKNKMSKELKISPHKNEISRVCEPQIAKLHSNEVGVCNSPCNLTREPIEGSNTSTAKKKPSILEYIIKTLLCGVMFDNSSEILAEDQYKISDANNECGTKIKLHSTKDVVCSKPCKKSRKENKSDEELKRGNQIKMTKTLNKASLGKPDKCGQMNITQICQRQPPSTLIVCPKCSMSKTSNLMSIPINQQNQSLISFKEAACVPRKNIMLNELSISPDFDYCHPVIIKSSRNEICPPRDPPNVFNLVTYSTPIECKASYINLNKTITSNKSSGMSDSFGASHQNKHPTVDHCFMVTSIDKNFVTDSNNRSRELNKRCHLSLKCSSSTMSEKCDKSQPAINNFNNFHPITINSSRSNNLICKNSTPYDSFVADQCEHSTTEECISCKSAYVAKNKPKQDLNIVSKKPKIVPFECRQVFIKNAPNISGKRDHCHPIVIKSSHSEVVVCSHSVPCDQSRETDNLNNITMEPCTSCTAKNKPSTNQAKEEPDEFQGKIVECHPIIIKSSKSEMVVCGHFPPCNPSRNRDQGSHLTPEEYCSCKKLQCIVTNKPSQELNIALNETEQASDCKKIEQNAQHTSSEKSDKKCRGIIVQSSLSKAVLCSHSPSCNPSQIPDQDSRLKPDECPHCKESCIAKNKSIQTMEMSDEYLQKKRHSQKSDHCHPIIIKSLESEIVICSKSKSHTCNLSGVSNPNTNLTPKGVNVVKNSTTKELETSCGSIHDFAPKKGSHKVMSCGKLAQKTASKALGETLNCHHIIIRSPKEEIVICSNTNTCYPSCKFKTNKPGTHSLLNENNTKSKCCFISGASKNEMSRTTLTSPANKDEISTAKSLNTSSSAAVFKDIHDIEKLISTEVDLKIMKGLEPIICSKCSMPSKASETTPICPYHSELLRKICSECLQSITQGLKSTPVCKAVCDLQSKPRECSKCLLPLPSPISVSQQSVPKVCCKCSMPITQDLKSTPINHQSSIVKICSKCSMRLPNVKSTPLLTPQVSVPKICSKCLMPIPSDSGSIPINKPACHPQLSVPKICSKCSIPLTNLKDTSPKCTIHQSCIPSIIQSDLTPNTCTKYTKQTGPLWKDLATSTTGLDQVECASPCNARCNISCPSNSPMCIKPQTKSSKSKSICTIKLITKPAEPCDANAEQSIVVEGKTSDGKIFTFPQIKLSDSCKLIDSDICKTCQRQIGINKANGKHKTKSSKHELSLSKESQEDTKKCSYRKGLTNGSYGSIPSKGVAVDSTSSCLSSKVCPSVRSDKSLSLASTDFSRYSIKLTISTPSQRSKPCGAGICQKMVAKVSSDCEINYGYDPPKPSNALRMTGSFCNISKKPCTCSKREVMQDASTNTKVSARYDVRSISQFPKKKKWLKTCSSKRKPPFGICCDCFSDSVLKRKTKNGKIGAKSFHESDYQYFRCYL